MFGGTLGADGCSAPTGTWPADRRPNPEAPVTVCTGAGLDRTSGGAQGPLRRGSSVWVRTEAYACSVT